MAGFRPEVLFGHAIPEVVQTLTPRDAILYALSLGAGDNPVSTLALEHCLEDRLRALPMQAVVMGYPGFWLKDTAGQTCLDWQKVLHGEQRLRAFAPLPVEGSVTGRSTITGLIDKGRNAALFSKRQIIDGNGAAVAEVSQTTILRGHGGFGTAFGEAAEPLAPVPNRASDLTVTRTMRADAALLYRLNGDRNPLHADPDVARAAGFDRPILHGLCTFGVAGLALIDSVCEGRSERLHTLAARFSAPVYPGEALRLEIWQSAAGSLQFQATAADRAALVLSHGTAEVTP